VNVRIPKSVKNYHMSCTVVLISHRGNSGILVARDYLQTRSYDHVPVVAGGRGYVCMSPYPIEY
jgi:hypothetical protein